MKDEVELSADDYEVMPLTPLRKLEKRLERLEMQRSTHNFERLIDKILDMTELNQRIIDEVVKANQGLREDIAVLIGKLDNLHDKVDEFVTMIKEAGENESEDKLAEQIVEKSVKPLVEAIEKSNNEALESNKMMVDLLMNIEKRLKRMQAGTLAPKMSGGVAIPKPQPASPVNNVNQM